MTRHYVTEQVARYENPSAGDIEPFTVIAQTHVNLDVERTDTGWAVDRIILDRSNHRLIWQDLDDNGDRRTTTLERLDFHKLRALAAAIDALSEAVR